MRTLATIVLPVVVLLSSGATSGAEAKLDGPAPFFFVATYNPDRCGEKLVFLDRLVGKKAVEAKTAKKVLLITFFNIDCKDYRKEKVAELLGFVEKSGFTFPVLKDRFQALQRRYGVESFPTMFILDGQGSIKDIRVGYNQEKMPFPLADIQRRLGVKEEPIEF
jgi:hypothetical protein